MRKSVVSAMVVSAAAAVSVMIAGCAAADDVTLEKNPDRVASTSAALVAHVDCNSGQYVTSTVMAQNLTPGAPNAVYRKPLTDLFTELSACTTTACAEQSRYTSAIYSQVYGAAGYYYKVADKNLNGQWMVWIAIPVLDSTTLSPGYYQSYPTGQNVIHTPQNAAPTFPSLSFVTAASPFWLRDNDHANLWAVRDGAYNTANVQGTIKREQCVAIVDPNGSFLDYSAELEEHDPNGCGGCSHY